MPRHDLSVRLRHMLDHAREAIEMCQNRTKEDLHQDRQFNLALVRLLEIIGEAANRVPPPERVWYADIPWAEIVSMRNRLIHGYDTVDFDILWEIATRDLPALVAVLEKSLQPD
jgi:uncharacterized protein with HEPN domain